MGPLDHFTRPARHRPKHKTYVFFDAVNRFTVLVAEIFSWLATVVKHATKLAKRGKLRLAVSSGYCFKVQVA